MNFLNHHYVNKLLMNIGNKLLIIEVLHQIPPEAQCK